MNVETLDGSARGATDGVSVKIRGILCCPLRLREAYWGFPTSRGPTSQQPTHNYPACLIAYIFVITGDIGGLGWGQEHEGRGERPQGPEGGAEERKRYHQYQ